MAQLLELSERTVQRLRRDGMPPPEEGEEDAVWLQRATTWREENRKRPGPRRIRPPVTEKAGPDSLERMRLAKAELYEMQVQEKREQLHSTVECELEDARRWSAVMSAIKKAGTRLARRCGNQNPTPETLQVAYDEEVSLAIHAMKRGQLGELSDG